MEYIFSLGSIFFIGLFLGSFLLVVADRSASGKSFLLGRSVCDSCGRTLSWKELIPVASYLIQKGKCRHCHTKLSVWYPVSEILTGSVLTLTFVAFAGAPAIILLANLIIVCCLLIIFFADKSYEIIPLPAVVVAVCAALVNVFITSPDLLISHILSGIGSGLFFFSIFFVTKGRGMGFGDVIFATFMGLLLGFPAVLFALYIAFVSGAIVSLFLVLLRKKKLRGGTVPFGPFLAGGTFIMMIGRDVIFHLASNFFGLSFLL